jgi:hypothetical protein
MKRAPAGALQGASARGTVSGCSARATSPVSGTRHDAATVPFAGVKDTGVAGRSKPGVDASVVGNGGAVGGGGVTATGSAGGATSGEACSGRGAGGEAAGSAAAPAHEVSAKRTASRRRTIEWYHWRMGRAPFCLALLAVLGAARDARPCIDLLSTEVLPAAAPAPVTTHVWIHHPTLRRKGNWARPPAAPYDADFVLRSVAPTVMDVPVAARECPYTLVELAPLSPLPKNARFEVWVVPQAAAAPPALLASFTTGADADVTPPPTPSFTFARLAVPTIRTSCGDTYAITLYGPTAPAAPATDSLYGLWPSDPTGTIGWDAAPMAIVRGARLDSHETCMPSYGAWAASSPRLGVRAIDLSGNLSAPIELRVEREP